MTNSLHPTLGRAAKALFAVALLVAPVSAFAQDDPSAAPAMQSAPSGNAMSMQHHRGHKGGMWKEFKQLNLTDEQKSKLKSIHEKFRADHPDMKQTSRADMKAMHQEMMSVLTPDQQAKLKQIEANHRQMKHKHSQVQPNQMPTVAP